MTTKTEARHPFGELLAQYRARKPGLTQTRLAELAGYNQAILVRMAQGKKDLTGPSGRERVVRLIETLADQGALTTLDEANALMLAADMPPLFERNLNEARLITRLARLPIGQRVRRTNLPAPLTSFVGRAQEIAEVRRLLGLTRLLTLTGAGGCGKTRLAQRIAADVRITYSEGVWYAELAALADPALIPDVVARALGLIAVDRPAHEQVLDYLRERQVLLVLDNCEHLIEAVAAFSIEVLRACPRVTILTTSREALNVEGETAWRVPPMQPDEAGRLFVDRAAAARSDAPLSAQDKTVAHICQRLDGMPLAIELAAARLSALSLSDIAARLEDRFALLVGGRRGALPRHQTLRALMDWSYDSLSEPEKIVFRRLGVFVGGWELKQAEQVVTDPSGILQSTVFSSLTQLIAKSLVVVDNPEGVTRYFYLETIRQYAHERLIEHGELESMRSRHAEAFADLSERSVVPLRGGGQKVWMNRLERERANIHAVLTWGFAKNGDCLVALRMMTALTQFWIWIRFFDSFREVRHWYTEAMQTMNEATPPLIRAGILNAAGHFNVLSMQASDRIELCRTALKLYQDANDKSGIAFALCNIGGLQPCIGQILEGESSLEQGITLAQEMGDDWVVRFGLAGLSWSAYQHGDVARASTLSEKVLELCCEAEDWAFAGEALLLLTQLAMDAQQFAKALDYAKEAEALAVSNGLHSNQLDAKMRMAQANYYLGDYQLALSILGECLAIAQKSGHEISMVKGLMARVINATGDHQNAQLLLNQVLDMFLKTMGMHDHLGGELFDFMACVAITRGDMQQGSHLFGAGEAVYFSINSKRLARHEWEFAPYIAKARTALGDAAYEAAYAEGRAMTLEQAIAYALADQIGSS